MINTFQFDKNKLDLLKLKDIISIIKILETIEIPYTGKKNDIIKFKIRNRIKG